MTIQAKPRICVISYKGLTRLVNEVAESFADQATIEIIDVVFDNALDKARTLAAENGADVIITAGANAALIRSSLSLPVAAIKISGFDVLLALLRAKNFAERVGVVIYRETIPELEAIKALLNLEISQRTYASAEDIRLNIEKLRQEGYSVVIGSSLAVECAEQAGMQGILIYSPNAVRGAFEDAIEIARIAKLENARYEQLNTLLYHLREAVLSVDLEGRITALNSAMANILDVQINAAINRPLQDVGPEFRIDSVLKSGLAELDQIVSIGGLSFISNRIPIEEFGIRTGALITLQDVRSIEKADTTIRSQQRVKQLSAKYQFDQLSGSSRRFLDAKEAAKRYAKSESTLLITGESGTGKELFAQAIHNASAARFGPFVAINCAAFPEPLLESELFGYEEGAFTGSKKGGKPGLFETAHKGTLFLDEIGDMPVSLQTRLLRVLQEKEIVRLGSAQPIPINVRVIAATHQPLRKRVEEGTFRADLYYRLNILHLDLPPLRDRSDDIPALALQLFHKGLRRMGSPLPADQVLAPLIPLFRRYDWPGNVRELENIIERLAVALSDYRQVEEINYQTLSDDFPEIFQAPAPQAVYPSVRRAPLGSSSAASDRTIDAMELNSALVKASGNKARAAEILGISRTTLWRHLKALKEN